MTLHVLNVSGVMLSGRDDALEAGIRRDLRPDTLLTLAPIPKSRAMDPPAAVIRDAGERIDAFLASVGTRTAGAAVVGVGRSFGGYVLLKAVSEVRARLDAFTLLVAVEAPLHPDVPVGIPPLLPVLLPASGHYRARAALAAEMVEALGTDGRSKVLSIGGLRDAVIAPLSQRLPDAGGPDVHVTLPRFAPGFAAETVLLPRSYREHLTWSDEKLRTVTGLIGRGRELLSSR